MPFLLVYLLLELGIFVLICNQLGFFLTVAIYILINIVLVSAINFHIQKSLVKLREVFDEYEERMMASDNFDAQAMAAQVRQMLNRRMIFLAAAKLCFLFPGMLTKPIGLILWFKSLSKLPDPNGKQNEHSFFEDFVDKRFSNRTFYRYKEEMYQRYGKSERDMQKEAEEAEQRRRKKSPVPERDMRAGTATVSEMKAKFQEGKEIKEGKFEEVVETPEPPNNEGKDGSDSSFKA